MALCTAATPREKPQDDGCCGCTWYLNAAGYGFTHDRDERPKRLDASLGADLFGGTPTETKR